MFKIIPKDKKLLKNKAVREYLRKVEAEISKDVKDSFIDLMLYGSAVIKGGKNV